MSEDIVDGSKINIRELRAEDIAVDHLALLIWNGKTGAESRQGARHLYSDRYKERWPREQYPEKYLEDEI